jgi:hypothetical protein
MIIVMAMLMAASTARAEYEFPSYFTMGENDTLRIAAGNDTVTVPVRAHFDKRVQRWNLTLTWPEGLQGVTATEGPGMRAIPYRDSQGEEHTCNAMVTASQDLTTVSSIITQTAYWPNPYGGSSLIEGKAMWEAGDYEEMFYLTFKVEQGFNGGTLSFDGMLVGNGSFGGVGQVMFYCPVTVVVTRAPGDVNGDGEVGISDVTALINNLLAGTASVATDDVDGDGSVNISDVTALINLLLSSD